MFLTDSNYYCATSMLICEFLYLAYLIFFFPLGVALEEAIKSTESAELVGVANEKMILLLSGNLTSGDPSLLLQMASVPCQPNLKKVLLFRW